MSNNGTQSAIERAMQLAREGKHESVNAIRQQVDREGFSDANAHLKGRAITEQIRKLLAAARS